MEVFFVIVTIFHSLTVNVVVIDYKSCEYILNFCTMSNASEFNVYSKNAICICSSRRIFYKESVKSRILISTKPPKTIS